MMPRPRRWCVAFGRGAGVELPTITVETADPATDVPAAAADLVAQHLPDYSAKLTACPAGMVYTNVVYGWVLSPRGVSIAFTALQLDD